MANASTSGVSNGAGNKSGELEGSTGAIAVDKFKKSVEKLREGKANLRNLPSRNMIELQREVVWVSDALFT